MLLQKDGDDYKLAAVNSQGSYDNIGIDSGTREITVNGIKGTSTIRLVCNSCKFEDGEIQKQVEVKTGTQYTLPTVIPDDGYAFSEWRINGQPFAIQKYSFVVYEDCDCIARCIRVTGGGGGG